MSRPKRPRPTRAFVEEIIRREAERAGLSETDIVFGPQRAHSAARYRCWKAIREGSGCSAEGLAEAWGVDRRSILYGLAWIEARAA